MRYQLVLQFRGGSLDDLDAIVALEEQLIAQLAEIAEVDGHDIGSDEANLFIFTAEPIKTFVAIEPVLERAGLLSATTAAYRDVDGDDYTLVWHARSNKMFRLA